MAFEIRRGRLDERRRWNYTKMWTEKRVQISCPQCGRPISIFSLDLVDEKGSIRTPVICPHRCDFQETNVRLVGWDPKQLD